MRAAVLIIKSKIIPDNKKKADDIQLLEPYK